MGGLRETCRAVCPPAATSANYGIDTANRIARTKPLQQAPRARCAFGVAISPQIVLERVKDASVDRVEALAAQGRA
jgi:hypothetical protein